MAINMVRLAERNEIVGSSSQTYAPPQKVYGFASVSKLNLKNGSCFCLSLPGSSIFTKTSVKLMPQTHNSQNVQLN